MIAGRPTALIIGGSSGLGLALAKELAKGGYNLHLVARGQRDLESVKNHLTILYGVGVSVTVFDLVNGSAFQARKLVEKVLQKTQYISHLFLVSGANSPFDKVPVPEKEMASMFMINALGPINILNEIVKIRKTIGLRSVTVCSSIAVPVPRSNNVLYASAKGALETFTHGCRHYLSSANIPVQIYRLGYIATNLTYGKKLVFPIASAPDIAKVIVSNFYKDLGLRYLPQFWFFVVLILKALPWSVYRKLSF